jgi:hypothetical protein
VEEVEFEHTFFKGPVAPGATGTATAFTRGATNAPPPARKQRKDGLSMDVDSNIIDHEPSSSPSALSDLLVFLPANVDGGGSMRKRVAVAAPEAASVARELRSCPEHVVERNRYIAAISSPGF